VKLYIYPMRKDAYEMYIAQGGGGHGSTSNAFASNVLINAKNVKIVDHLSNLYAHLLENHYIDCIVGFDSDILSIFSRDVLRRIKERDPNVGEDGPDAGRRGDQAPRALRLRGPPVLEAAK
jgi:hypothetical protein